MSAALSPHYLIPITDVEHSWGALHSALMLTSQAQLRQSPKPRKPWISQSTMLLAEQKNQLWRAWQASQTPATKALYKAANRASRQAAVADYQQHWSSQLAQVQNSMRKGDLHSAYRCLNQLSKPKAQLSRTLRSKHTGRLLQSPEERIAEWTSHTTVLLAFSTPIPPSTLALLPPPPPPSTAPYPEPTFDETVKAIRLLKNNKSPGVCNTLPEMLKEGGEDVHLALHRLFLGIWRTEAAPKHFKQDTLIPIAKKGDSSLCANYRTIALQSIAAKAYANVLGARLSKCLGTQLLEQQYGTEAAQTLCSAYAVSRIGMEQRHDIVHVHGV